MSTPALLPRRLTRPERRPRPGRPLSVVPRRRPRAPRVPFLALVTVTLVGGVVGLLLFNTSMQQASFAATNLEEEAEALTAKQQTLEMEVEELRDPQRIAQAAQDLGMVQPASSGFVRPDGSIVGEAVPAGGGGQLRLRARPPARPRVLDPAPVVVQPERGRNGGETRQGSRRGADGPASRRDRASGDG
jgi:cell division protein FtsL